METLTRTLVPVTKSIPPTKVETVPAEPTTAWWKSILDGAESVYRDEIAKSIASTIAPESLVGFWAWYRDAEPTTAELLSMFGESF